MTRRLILILMLFFSLGGLAQAQVNPEKDPFLVDYENQIVHVAPGATFPFVIKFTVPKDYYLYDDKISMLFEKTGDIILLKTDRPVSESHFDPFFKKITQIFSKNFEIKVWFTVPKEAKPGPRTLEAVLRYQGCSSEFCYRPTQRKLLLTVEVEAAKQQILRAEAPQIPPKQETKISEAGEPHFWDYLDEVNPERLLERGKVYLLGLALVGGMLTSFTPCVLPIIPLTLAFIGVRHRRRGNFLRAAMLVFGMVSMYSLLGFLAASLGLKLGFLFQSRLFVMLTALFFLFFALALFEVIPFHLPPKLHHRLVRMGGEGPWGAYVAGLTVGLIASPCVGPLIAPLLLIAAREQDRIYGFALLFNYGMGMGLLFLALGSAYAEIASKLKGGRWTHTLKHILGALMLAPAIYYGYIFAQPYLASSRDSMWVYQFKKGLTLAETSTKPILLDFYADWCPPCLELDKRTFSNSEIRELAKQFVMLKIDCSVDDLNCQEATENYEVVGWPTILFLNSHGEPISDLKLVGGFVDKERMLQMMNEALKRSK